MVPLFVLVRLALAADCHGKLANCAAELGDRDLLERVGRRLAPRYRRQGVVRAAGEQLSLFTS